MMTHEQFSSGIKLIALLDGFCEFDSADDRILTGIKSDSRLVENGDLFFACSGQQTAGSEFIDEAINAGACAVVVERGLGRSTSNKTVPIIETKNLNEKLGYIADRFYGSPSADLNLIGVTGTNGKTSIAHITANVLSKFGKKDAGVIGTLGTGTNAEMTAGINTTPDAISIQKTLAEFRSSGSLDVVMEVSSHGLAQARVAGVKFDIGVFSNLSHEHLDYHGDMASYAATKRQLFLNESMTAAVINVDDDFGRNLSSELENRMQVINYGLKQESDESDKGTQVTGFISKAQIASLIIDVESPWGRGEINSRLTGEFNAANLLASLSAACLSGVDFEQALAHLSNSDDIPGRMECFSKSNSPQVLVDYAHTPDALEKSLHSLRQFEFDKLICVVGCGGDRDVSKRPEMGRIAEKYADRIIFTNDNPRSEDPDSIIEDMLGGTLQPDFIKVIQDRSTAIADAIENAGEKDVVLIAGKGHETYQEIQGSRLPFSDRQLVRNILGLTA
ncbi:MAG: UDP-N-acetylmuramoyl-L-alanyl-D-glutamate--2,6-diaminopimelate ligase [Gammaproteobacteria bacterium]|nr:UDP-N-acetylmuramoyl-L-alanyl-D-glutamate--2,6-diaminopimelate ligase [Gammaproteobacteria bacterium]